MNHSSASVGASATMETETETEFENVKTVNFASEIEVETINDKSYKSIVKQERIVSKVLPVKIVPKGKKSVITIKDEPGGSKVKNTENSNISNSNSNSSGSSSSNYNENSDDRTETNDQSYYDVEEEFEGGHMNEDEGDD